MHRELRRPNMTLALLWEEYRAGPGAQDGFGYSWFCDLYREWVGRLKPTLRQVHTAGERVFVDFAGHAMEVIDGATGEIRRAEVFVAVLGASSYTYAEAVWTQSLPDWIAAHAAMLAFIGGVPRQIVSDNLRAGITRACFYEPLVNRTYADLASHYGTAIIPAHPYKPRRQGQGRGRRAGGAALDPGAAARPAILLVGRAEPGDPRSGRPIESRGPRWLKRLPSTTSSLEGAPRRPWRPHGSSRNSATGWRFSSAGHAVHHRCSACQPVISSISRMRDTLNSINRRLPRSWQDVRLQYR